MGGERGDRMPEGQMERGTTLACENCRGEFTPKNRNGVPARYCSRKCLDADRNARRLKGAASLNQKKTPTAPRKASIRTLDQLSAAEGLPSGCFSAGSLGRLVGRPAGESTLSDLVSAARRLGLTEEGETLKAARLAARRDTGTGAAA